MRQNKALLLLSALAVVSTGVAAAGSAPCSGISYDLYPNSTGQKAAMVVGQSAPFSGPHMQTGVDVRAGIRAALAIASETSSVLFELASLDDAYDPARQQQNTQTLLCTGANGLGPAFAIAGNVGSSASERVLSTLERFAGSDGVPVPFVGGLTGSERLRTRSFVLQNSSKSGARTGVALARAGGGDEVSAIVSFLSGTWSVLNSTSIFYQDMPFGREVAGYFTTVLRVNGGASPLSSYGHAIVTTPSDLSAMAEEAVDALCANGDPKAVVLVAVGSMSGALVQAMSNRGKKGIKYVGMSWVTPQEIYSAVPSSVWLKVRSQMSFVYFSQVVPMPDSTQIRLVTEYRSAMQKYQPGMNISHASLEGFVAGRLVTTAASRALELNGWPLTRASFLDAIFRDIRTFKLYGSYTLGPYGDGVGSTGAAQTEEDWCNQGAHEVYMTELDLWTGELVEVESWSFKFSGCAVSGWNDTSNKVVVGFDYTEEVNSVDMQMGLSAAAWAHNSDGVTQMVLTTVKNETVDTAVTLFHSRGVVAIAGLAESEIGSSLKLMDDRELLVALIAPLSGLQRLRRPFRRGVVNLFASYYQEVRTAASLLLLVERTEKVCVLWNSETHNEVARDIITGLQLSINRDLLGLNTSDGHVKTADRSFANITSDTADYITSRVAEGFSFIIVALAGDAWELMQHIGDKQPVVLTSVVSLDVIWRTMYFDDGSANRTWRHVYRTSQMPQLAMMSTSNALRQDFESWVSGIDQVQQPFEGFFIGRFISAVLQSMAEDGSPEEVTAEALLDAIYTKKYFKIDNRVSVGPFLDQSSGERPCNQGMDTAYVTQWDWEGFFFDYVAFTVAEDRRCGKEFDPPETPDGGGTALTVILSTTIPGFALVCTLLAAVIAVQRRGGSALKKLKRSELEIGERIGKGQFGTVHNGDWHGTPVAIRRRGGSALKKLKRSELEIGERIGKGQFGTVHNGDWHGTPVAIRVVDKTAVTREDLDSIKSEMALTSSMHHPNLLMVLGYSETKSDLLIVSEYMASGSLHEYLKKNKQNMNYYNQVAIAFDTIKGLAFLHSAKPPVVHGNLSSQSLMIDGSMVTKICDFWCSKGKNSSSSGRRRSNWLAPELIDGKPATTASDVFEPPNEQLNRKEKCMTNFNELQQQNNNFPGLSRFYDKTAAEPGRFSEQAVAIPDALPSLDSVGIPQLWVRKRITTSTRRHLTFDVAQSQWKRHNNRVYTAAEEVSQGLAKLDEHAARRSSPPVAGLPSSWIAPTVTPVRDQGQCGSSWAIATTSVMESAWFENTGNMTQFSVQQVVDCDPSSDGCSRGTESGPYDYIISLTRQGGGFEKEETYPYTAEDGQCNYSADRAVGKFSDFFYVDFFEERIDSDLVNFGPLSFGMDATTLQFYESGVLENSVGCMGGQNYLVVLIGWGVDASGKYWVAKTPKCEMECGYESDGCGHYKECGLCDWHQDLTCGANHTCIKDFYDGPNVDPALDTITIVNPSSPHAYALLRFDTRVGMVVDFKGLLPTMCFVNYSFVPEFGAPWVDFRCPMAGLLGMWNNTYHWFARIPMFEEHNLLEITAWCVYNGQEKHYAGHNDTTRFVRFQYNASASSASSGAIRAISDDTGSIGVAQGVSASEAAKIAVTVQGDDLSDVQCAVAYSVLDHFGEEWVDVHEVGMQGEHESWYLAVAMPAAWHVLEAKVGCQSGTGAKVWTTEKYLFQSLGEPTIDN
eukprot:m51a1_g11471 putative flag-tagged protein kinase domain of mitogen-activated protein kinase kinase kinase (1719) ;mRNA; r:4786-13054